LVISSNVKYIFIRVIELMELDYKKIGIRIKEERLNRDISQEKLAEFINMSEQKKRTAISDDSHSIFFLLFCPCS